MTKKEVLKNLKKNLREEENITNAKYISKIIRLVSKSKRLEYRGASVSLSQKGNLNFGCLLERIVLDYFHLEREDNNHEIKCYVNNTTNILTNENVKICYVLLISEVHNGLYRVDADLIRNIKLRKKYLISLILNNKMVRVASLNKLATC